MGMPTCSQYGSSDSICVSGVLFAVFEMNKAGCITKMLFNYAMRHKKHYMDRGMDQDKASPLFDALVFGKIKAALGGRVQIIISGGAPLSQHVEEFLKQDFIEPASAVCTQPFALVQVAMCAIVVQGYGLTETMAGAAISLPNTPGGNVGPPLPGVKLRLESSTELNYDALADPPRGEVSDTKAPRTGLAFTGVVERLSSIRRPHIALRYMRAPKWVTCRRQP
eukprot:scaffold28990_cov32-Prasinocladus_malaysianus.AAC.3